MDVFRLFRPSGERREGRPEKRRAQVRRAQQTYRLRKEQYTKSLENEVGRLRAIETDLVHETKHLRSTIQMLGNLLAESGLYVNLSPILAREGTEREPNAGPPCHRSPSEGHHVEERAHPDLSRARHTGAGAAAVPSEPWSTLCSKGPSLRDGPSTRPESPQDTWLTGLRNNHLVFLDPNVPVSTDHYVPAATSRHRGVRLGDLDPTTVGMEFVLALEEPCLGHIHGDPDNPEQPNGHALTVSSQLLFLPSPSPPDAKDLRDARAKAPAPILDRLLALSSSLTLEDEVTPVQAWNRIRSQPQFDQLRIDRLQSLTKELGEVVKCHGFGAVFKVDVLEKLVREELTERPAFLS
ncbi:hypothetical protein MFIFM68171_03598 [Madurella fahalii]|uniref:BZIP domain-containing protein n=1 Tax=Madurella fahalii TaxID=1157608 RepID=A0ABQ0G6J8_9PEZI